MTGFSIPPKERPRPAATGDGSVGNLYAPFFDVVFYSFEKQLGRDEDVEANRKEVAANPIGESRILLRSRGGDVVEFGVDGDLVNIRNFRSSLTIEGVSAGAYSATLTLTPPFLDGIDLIDRRLIKLGGLMEIQWGYLGVNGGPVISDKGIFTIRQPSIRFGQQIQIQINGVDLFSFSAKSLEARIIWPREHFKTDLDVLRTLTKKILGDEKRLNAKSIEAAAARARAMEQARQAVAAVSPGVTISSDIPKIPKLVREKDENLVQTEPNWTFFRRICNANDVTFNQVGNEVVLHEMSRADLFTPKYRLVWWMQPQTDVDIPMMSFETNPVRGYFAQPGVRGLKRYTVDPDTGVLVVTEHLPETTAGPGPNRSEAQEAGHPKDVIQLPDGSVKPFSDPEEGEAGRNITTPSERPNEEDEVEEEARFLARESNTKATATCVGVPGLLPQMIVRVEGVGRTFGGNYRVKKVTHEIGAGYIMKLDLIRTASTGDDRDSTPATKGKGNTKTVTASSINPGEDVAPKDGGS